ncbi:amino acid ABC transporter permease [uncultured Alsobacter sp.]|uniref:amino acid ABC transporter permease n=1 Tax=uncultured Alsobacter sp. TaxID=1748258 RepID=UPI0025CED2C7|nr:amino acid ABC transporter permease [uncultured Alsobacter sp.]
MQEFAHYFFNMPVMMLALPQLLQGLLVTVQMGVLVVVLGIGLGLLLAVVRSFRFAPVNVLIVIFVDVFRAIPALVVLMLIYFALPSVGVTLPPFASAVVTLALVLAAFAEEIIWAGITAVDKGQWEAARSTGLGPLQTLFYVVLFQAIRMVIPPLTNRAIAVTKNTAIASAVSVQEMLNVASSQQAIYANPTPLTLAALLYLALFVPFTILSRLLERRYRWGR